MALHTGQPMEKIHKDCDRNLWLRADEAVTYGVVDKIMTKAPADCGRPGRRYGAAEHGRRNRSSGSVRGLKFPVSRFAFLFRDFGPCDKVTR